MVRMITRLTKKQVLENIKSKTCVCIRCKEEKPFSEFNKIVSSIMGISSTCRVCTNKNVATRHESLSDKEKERLKQNALTLRINNKERYAEIYTRNDRKSRLTVDDRYIKGIIFKNRGKEREQMPFQFISAEILELKRQLIKFKREVYGK